MHQGESRLQPARRARGDLGHRTAELHPAGARACESLRRSMAAYRRRRGMSEQPEIGGRAPLPIELQAGKDYWWCACGRSAKQPFCDGSHKGTNFTPMKYTAEKDGRAFFCTCKRSGKAPLCDGSHKA